MKAASDRDAYVAAAFFARQFTGVLCITSNGDIISCRDLATDKMSACVV